MSLTSTLLSSLDSADNCRSRSKTIIGLSSRLAQIASLVFLDYGRIDRESGSCDRSDDPECAPDGISRYPNVGDCA